MSLQTSMHSLQMKTVGLSFKAGITFLGPAISFRTSAWALLQNEQRSIGSLGVLTRLLNIRDFTSMERIIPGSGVVSQVYNYPLRGARRGMDPAQNMYFSA